MVPGVWGEGVLSEGWGEGLAPAAGALTVEVMEMVSPEAARLVGAGGTVRAMFSS